MLKYLLFVVFVYCLISFVHPYLPLLVSLLLVLSLWFVELPLRKIAFSFGSVYLLPTSKIGAFSLGNKIVFTRGLLESLSEPELKAVYYHELSHVKNKDQVFLVLLILVFLLLYHFVPSFYVFPYIVSVSLLFVWFYWQVELRADYYAYLKVGKDMIEVLRKVRNVRDKFRFGISLHPPLDYRIKRLEELG